MRYDIKIPLNFFKQTKNAPRSDMCCVSIQKKSGSSQSLFLLQIAETISKMSTRDIVVTLNLSGPLVVIRTWTFLVVLVLEKQTCCEQTEWFITKIRTLNLILLQIAIVSAKFEFISNSIAPQIFLNVDIGWVLLPLIKNVPLYVCHGFLSSIQCIKHIIFHFHFMQVTTLNNVWTL